MERDCFGDGRILCGGEDKARWDGGQLTERLGGGGGGLVRPNWLRWSKFRGSSQTWGVLGASVDTALWPKKPDEERLPWCLIVGCRCIS